VFDIDALDVKTDAVLQWWTDRLALRCVANGMLWLITLSVLAGLPHLR
jgi:hypothetical protein